MKLYEVKINHQKHFGKDGCVYQKGFNIDRKIYESFMDALKCEIITREDNVYWLKALINTERYEKEILKYMNVTQTEFFVKWCLRNANIKINEKRANLRANGYLIIKECLKW